MDKKIQFLELVFENCDTIKFEYIPHKFQCFLEDIVERIYIVNGNLVDKGKTAKRCFLTIPNECLNAKTHFDELFSKVLEFKNITSVYLHYDNNKNEGFSVVWSCEDTFDSYNEWQINSYNDNSVEINIKEKS